MSIDIAGVSLSDISGDLIIVPELKALDFAFRKLLVFTRPPHVDASPAA